MSTLLLDRSRNDRSLFADSALTLGMAAVFAFIALVLARGLMSFPSDRLMWLLPAAPAVLSLGFGFVAVWHYFGRERVELEAGSVHATRFLGPFRSRWSVRLEDIMGIDVPALGREFVQGSWGVGQPSLHVRTRWNTLQCCVGIAPAEAQRIGAAMWEAVQNAGAGRPTTR
jgi:hypothetical protein